MRVHIVGARTQETAAEDLLPALLVEAEELRVQLGQQLPVGHPHIGAGELSCRHALQKRRVVVARHAQGVGERQDRAGRVGAEARVLSAAGAAPARAAEVCCAARGVAATQSVAKSRSGRIMISPS